MTTPKLQLKKHVVIGKGNEAATTNQFLGDTKVPGKAGGKEHRNNKNNCNTCVKEERSEWKMESSTATGTSSSWLTFFGKKVINFKHSHSIFSSHALSFRDVSSETKSKRQEWFLTGHSAFSAGRTLESELHLQKKLADRNKKEPKS